MFDFTSFRYQNLEILNEIESWAEEIGAYGLTLVAVSALAMALLEALKSILKLKINFHERFLKIWLTEDLAFVRGIPNWAEEKECIAVHDGYLRGIAQEGAGRLISWASGIPRYQVDAGRRPWIEMTFSAERALYSLPLEQMMGQIQSATDIILENPDSNLEAYLLLTSNLNTRTQEDSDVEKWYRYNAENSRNNKLEMDDTDRMEIAQIGQRIQQSVQRQLDSFQLQAAYRWANWNQRFSFILGASILYIAIYTSQYGSEMKIDLLYIVLMSLLGGAVAPVAKDLVSNLKKVKTSG